MYLKWSFLLLPTCIKRTLVIKLKSASKLLFQVRKPLTLQERNTALIYDLQCDLYSEYYKDKNSTISISTKSSSTQHSPSNLEADIAYLKNHNNYL